MVVPVCMRHGPQAAAGFVLRRGDDRSTFQEKKSIVAHLPSGSIQTATYPARLPYDTVPIPAGIFFQGAVPETWKGSDLCFGSGTIEEISLISRWRFMYSSMHT